MYPGIKDTQKRRVLRIMSALIIGHDSSSHIDCVQPDSLHEALQEQAETEPKTVLLCRDVQYIKIVRLFFSLLLFLL